MWKRSNRKTAHFITIFGSNIRVICERQESWEEEGEEGMEERREEGITVGIVHHVCMLLFLHTPHLYHWVTVDLNCFVVFLWKQTLAYYSQ